MLRFMGSKESDTTERLNSTEVWLDAKGWLTLGALVKAVQKQQISPWKQVTIGVGGDI